MADRRVAAISRDGGDLADVGLEVAGVYLEGWDAHAVRVPDQSRSASWGRAGRLMRVRVALALVGHKLVHAIYVGHARRLYRVAPGAAWPDGSWALARAWSEAGTRWGVAIAFSLVEAAFAVAGVALLARAPWWGLVAGSAAFVSAVVLVLAWDGRLHGLGVQWAYAVVIDAAVVALALAVNWPAIDG